MALDRKTIYVRDEENPPEKNLLTILNRKIQQYIDENWKNSFENKVANFAKDWGYDWAKWKQEKFEETTGENRAEIYKESLQTERDLFTKVKKDLLQPQGQGPLGTSTELRKRLIEGLCEYKNITESEINYHISVQVAAMARGGQVRFIPVPDKHAIMWSLIRNPGNRRDYTSQQQIPLQPISHGYK